MEQSLLSAVANKLNCGKNKMKLNTPNFHSELQLEFCEEKTKKLFK